MARTHPATTPSFSSTDVIDVRMAVLDQHCETTTIRVDLSS